MSVVTFDALTAEADGRLPMNEPVFLAFYARTSGPVVGYLRKLTGNHAVAEDLLQETYLRFLMAVRLPDDEEHRKNYLFRIATNLARDHYRRAQREVARAETADRRADVAFDVTSHADGDVWARLALLSPRDRELLLLAYVEGLSHKEIGLVTGLVRASVKPLLFRARRRFAAVLREAGLGAPVSRGGVA